MENIGIVSVIVPCYNYGRFLGECLDSILAQTYTNWECIIVDDGSKDNTKEIAQMYEKKDKRIKYIYQENAGPNSARKNALSIAKGEYIQLLDADDFIEKEKLQTQIKIFEQNKDYHIVFSDVKLFYSDAQNTQKRFSDDTYEIPRISSNDPTFGFRILENPFGICCALVKKELFFENVLVTNIKFNEDWDFWLKCFLSNKKFIYHNDPYTLSWCRQHGNNATKKEWEIQYYRFDIRKNLRKKLVNDDLKKHNEAMFQKEKEFLLHISVSNLEKTYNLQNIKRLATAVYFLPTLKHFLYLLGGIFYKKLPKKIMNFSFSKRQ